MKISNRTMLDLAKVCTPLDAVYFWYVTCWYA